MDPKWRRKNFEDPGNMIRCIHRPTDNMPFLIEPLGTDTTAKEQALVLIMQVLQHDPVLSAFDFLSDPVSEKSLKNWIMKHLDQGFSNGLRMLAPERTLVGVDLVYVRNIYDEPESNKDSGKAYNNFIKFMKIIERYIKYYGRSQRLCNYLTSFGVFTSPICRYAEITKDMILYRTKIAHYHRIKVISVPFIGIDIQDFAEKNDYKPRKTFRHAQDMMELGVDLTHVDIFPIKIMDLFTFKRPQRELQTPKKKKKANAVGKSKVDKNYKNNGSINTRPKKDTQIPKKKKKKANAVRKSKVDENDKNNGNISSNIDENNNN